MADVFISYHTRSGSGMARQIAEDLEAHAISCWYAPRDVTVGAYARSIMEAIDACQVFLLILNEPATHSEHVLSELNAAFGRFNRHEAIALLPVRIDNCPLSQEMRYYLGPIHIREIPCVYGAIPTEEIVEIVSGVLKTFAAQSGEESAPAQTPPAQAEKTDEPERKKSPEEEEMERVYQEWKTEQRRKQEAQRRKAERKRKRRLDAVFVCVLIAIVGFFSALSKGEGGLPEPLADILYGQQTEQSLPDGESPSQEEASSEIQESSQQETQEDLPKSSQAYFTYRGNQIPVYDLPKRQVNAGDFVWDGDRLSYIGSQFDVSFGVNVSAYQNRNRSNGTLNWEAAKADGVEFAFVQVGFRGTTTGTLREDAYYARNIDGAMSAGILTGASIFSVAVNVQEALEDANFILTRLRNHPINGSVVYAWESNDASIYRNAEVSKETATMCAKAFCERVKEAGYTPMIYMPRYVGYVKYDLSELPYPIWYPQYPLEGAAKPYPNFLYQMDVWQFSDSTEVDGLGKDIYANLWFRPKASGSAED